MRTDARPGAAWCGIDRRGNERDQRRGSAGVTDTNERTVTAGETATDKQCEDMRWKSYKNL